MMMFRKGYVGLVLWLVFTCPSLLQAYSADSYTRIFYEGLAEVIDKGLEGKGKRAFLQKTRDVENNIFWHSQKRRLNPYVKAHQRCLPFLRSFERRDKPLFVFLIAYLESGWRGKVGNPNHDYGYWQMIPAVINEIKGLPESSDTLARSTVWTIQTNADLSTEAAYIHLHRYYFYFRQVAGFDEEQAWLFTLTAFNWGAGNVKRLLVEMEKQGVALSFSSFYEYLTKKSQRRKWDKSMRVAVEYVPNLWNIAKLLHQR